MRRSSMLQFTVAMACYLFINSCTEKPPVPDAASILSLKLKRGNVISCGPRDLTFGQVSFETSCKAGLKQDFDMGVALLHSFEYDEAEKVFAKIIDADPSCALAYWGVAMANYHTLWAPPNKEEFEKGSHAIAIARSLKPPTDREQAYIDAIAAFMKITYRPIMRHATLSSNKRWENFIKIILLTPRLPSFTHWCLQAVLTRLTNNL